MPGKKIGNGKPKTPIHEKHTPKHNTVSRNFLSSSLVLSLSNWRLDGSNDDDEKKKNKNMSCQGPFYEISTEEWEKARSSNEEIRKKKEDS